MTYLKNTLFKLILSLGLACLIIGCKGDDGRDGIPGDAYIAYSWMYGPISFSCDQCGIPGSTVLNEVYYETQPGTYDYCYEAWDYSVWCGYYTITRDEGTPGEEGGPFGQDGADGVDGDDNCFQLDCLSVGPSFYEWGCSSVRAMESHMEPKRDKNFKLEENKMKNTNLAISSDSKVKVFDGEFVKVDDQDSGVAIETGSVGKYSFKHVYKQIK